MWRNDIISVTTWKIKHLSRGGKIDRRNKNTQVFHLLTATVLKVSQTLHTASSHVSSHLLWINWQSVLPHRQVSSHAQIPLQTHGVLWKWIEQLDNCSKCWEAAQKQGFVSLQSMVLAPGWYHLTITDRCPKDSFLIHRAAFPIIMYTLKSL